MRSHTFADYRNSPPTAREVRAHKVWACWPAEQLPFCVRLQVIDGAVADSSGVPIVDDGRTRWRPVLPDGTPLPWSVVEGEVPHA
jgi:hypothetical protein